MLARYINRGIIPKSFMEKNIMKKLISCLMLCLCLPLFCGCEWWVKRTYNQSELWEELTYFPTYEVLDGCTVNDYVSRQMFKGIMSGTCYEYLLDITVDTEKFDDFIADARAQEGFAEQEAYYADGYYEIAYADQFRMYVTTSNDVSYTWLEATIDKIIYNPETCHIVYVHLAAPSGLKEGESYYFEYFNIDPREYIHHLANNEETKLREELGITENAEPNYIEHVDV